MGRDLNAKFYVGHTGKDSEKLLGNGGIAILRKVFGVILLAIAVKLFRTNMGI